MNIFMNIFTGAEVTQAPKSMKAGLQAFWLLASSFGRFGDLSSVFC